MKKRIEFKDKSGMWRVRVVQISKQEDLFERQCFEQDIETSYFGDLLEGIEVRPHTDIYRPPLVFV